MTCLRARKVLLNVARGHNTPQYPGLVVPEAWTRQQVLEHARAVHGPLGHTVTVLAWGAAELWLPDPVGFVDYTTGERA